MNQPGAAAGPHSDGSSRKVTLYRNGSIYTAADPFATAMVVDGDTVAWVGSEQAATSIADSSMEIIDLHGALLAPGFVDSHAHLTETGLALAGLQLSSIRSATELLDAVATVGGEGTILGHGWDETTWNDPTLPTLEEISRAAGDRPVYLSRVDVHSALVSASLVKAAGLESFDGFSGSARVVRAAHTAARLAARTFPEHERRGYQERALQEAASQGYVALAEMSAPHICEPGDLRMATSWNALGDRPEVLPYWGELASSQEHAKAILDGLGTDVLGLKIT